MLKLFNKHYCYYQLVLRCLFLSVTFFILKTDYGFHIKKYSYSLTKMLKYFVSKNLSLQYWGLHDIF